MCREGPNNLSRGAGASKPRTGAGAQLVGMQSREQGTSLDHSGFAGPLDSRATSLAEKPFPGTQRPGTAGKGGDYSSPRGLWLPGEEGFFSFPCSSLPSHQGWIFALQRPAGTSLSQAGGMPPVPMALAWKEQAEHRCQTKL